MYNRSHQLSCHHCKHITELQKGCVKRVRDHRPSAYTYRAMQYRDEQDALKQDGDSNGEPQNAPYKPLPAQKPPGMTLTNMGEALATAMLKRFQRLRQRVPFFNWLIQYGVPMASASLFLLDIVRCTHRCWGPCACCWWGLLTWQSSAIACSCMVCAWVFFGSRQGACAGTCGPLRLT
jgi:hypothetical protein